MEENKKRGILKKAILGLVIFQVVIQFIRPEKNISTVPQPQDIGTAYPMAPNVYHILQTSCYDCHSNNTKYPWYNNIQPVAWWLSDHIDEGKKELNFSEFGSYSPKRKLKKLREIVKQIEENEMPLSSYTLIHKDAILSDADKQLVIGWAKGLGQIIVLQTGYKDTAATKGQ